MVFPLIAWALSDLFRYLALAEIAIIEILWLLNGGQCVLTLKHNEMLGDEAVENPDFIAELLAFVGIRTSIRNEWIILQSGCIIAAILSCLGLLGLLPL